MTAEDRPVRERLAEVLTQQCGRCGGRGRESHQISRDPDDGTEDWPCPSCRGAGVTTKHATPQDLADAILSDADLLDDLCRERLEQVGHPPTCGVMLDRTAMALSQALDALRELVPNHHPARVNARKALDAWVEWSAAQIGSSERAALDPTHEGRGRTDG